MNVKKKFNQTIRHSLRSKKSLLGQFKKIELAIKIISESIKFNKKVMICGNGGSAADAQHLSAEFLVRLKPNVNRRPFPVIPLALDTSTITACSNDYDFRYLFSRNLEALGNKGDILIVISTSGNSKNIIEVSKLARKKKISVIGFLGNSGGKVKKYVDIALVVGSKNVARIQESHIMLGHFIFEEVENKLIR